MKSSPKQPSKPPIKQKYIESTDLMLDYFNQYREETKGNPIIVTDWVGAKAIEVDRRKERPLTLEGFSSWLFRNNITGNVYDYFGNKGGKYEAYSEICRAIKEAVRVDQIEGGMAGIYNPSITQRLNGLKEQSETTFVEQPLFNEEKE